MYVSVSAGIYNTDWKKRQENIRSLRKLGYKKSVGSGVRRVIIIIA